MMPRIRHYLHEFTHRSHSLSEFCHVGYFATAAGLFHEYHAVLAGACGILLVVAMIFTGGND